MITFFKNTSDGLTTIETAAAGCWIHAVDPTDDEIIYLRDNFKLPEAFIAASLDVDELARSDKENGVLLIIALVPYLYTEDPNDVPYSTTPLAIILTADFIITISKVHTNFVSDFTKKYARSVSTNKKNRLILQIFFSIAQHYLTYLRQIENQVDIIQYKVQKSLKNKELFDLLRYQKSLIYFTTALESNGLMMKRLQRNQLFETYPDDKDLLEDVLTENSQASQMTKISSDILSQMMDAYASIISNNLNDVMKILAVATIILSIPTVVASLYGMNVALPGQEVPWAFWAVIGTSLVIIAIISVIFWKRDWL